MKPTHWSTIWIALASLTAALATPALAGRWAARGWLGDPAPLDALANAVDAGQRRVGVDRFDTGAALFDEEWAFGAHQMAAMGHGGLAMRHPEHAGAHLAAMERALDRLDDADLAAFDAREWSASPWDALACADRCDGHAAFLGYAALPFALHRQLRPGTAYDAVEQRLIDALVARFEAADGAIETYPGERYPVDNAAGLAAIGLHDAATGEDHTGLLARWRAIARSRWVDPGTGLLFQAVGPEDQPLDAPRGSGTALAAWFWGWSDPALSAELYRASRAALGGSVLGLAAHREYPRGHAGAGDIDSGPIVAGFGVSATGFALGAARRHGDDGAARGLFATAWVFGRPVDTPSGVRFTAGGPLGDAILLAMLATPPVSALEGR